MELPSKDDCYRALQSRDARFDGLILVGVTSTGIYCRPICPARTPKYENCVFYSSSAASQNAGFRPCLRCRTVTIPRSKSRSFPDQKRYGRSDWSFPAPYVPDTFARQFQAHFRATPGRRVQSLRVEAARQHLEGREMPLKEIARLTGFRDEQALRRAFIQQTIETPKECRERFGIASAVTAQGLSANRPKALLRQSSLRPPE
jgi:AraC family transcriptional regulator of adaptative response / DNA-3-methyladenine glycosylase II